MSEDTDPSMDGSRGRTASNASSWTEDGVGGEGCTCGGSAYTFETLYASLFGMTTVAEEREDEAPSASAATQLTPEVPSAVADCMQYADDDDDGNLCDCADLCH